jgi:hypothetical protein
MAIRSFARIFEIDDATAYMALALNNAQGELSPLEVGLHALHSGLSMGDYAERVGISKSDVDRRRAAATVLDACPHMGTIDPDNWRHLAEIHTAPEWLWSALVSRMVADDLTVEATRKLVAGVKDAPAACG